MFITTPENQTYPNLKDPGGRQKSDLNPSKCPAYLSSSFCHASKTLGLQSRNKSLALLFLVSSFGRAISLCGWTPKEPFPAGPWSRSHSAHVAFLQQPGLATPQLHVLAHLRRIRTQSSASYVESGVWRERNPPTWRSRQPVSKIEHLAHFLEWPRV